MSRLFQPIPAKPAFGVLQKNGYASDYTKKLKLKQAFGYSIKNQTRSNLSQGELLSLKNCELKNNLIFNKSYLDKTNLIAGLYSKENLEGIVTVSPSSETEPPYSSTTIDISNSPFYGYYNIDPEGALFGNTPCGIKNYSNYMQITVPIIDSNESLKSCIPLCNSFSSQVCTSVCNNSQ